MSKTWVKVLVLSVSEWRGWATVCCYFFRKTLTDLTVGFENTNGTSIVASYMALTRESFYWDSRIKMGPIFMIFRCMHLSYDLIILIPDGLHTFASYLLTVGLFWYTVIFWWALSETHFHIHLSLPGFLIRFHTRNFISCATACYPENK